MAGPLPVRPAPGDCRALPAGVAAGASDVQRIVRYDALLQLVAEIQRERTPEAVAQVVAHRFMHCAGVLAWRMLAETEAGTGTGTGTTVATARSAGAGTGDRVIDPGPREATPLLLMTAAGRLTEVAERLPGQLCAWDRRQWSRRLPASWTGEMLEALRRPRWPSAVALAELDGTWPVLEAGAAPGDENGPAAPPDARAGEPPLPAVLADPLGTALLVLPVQQGEQTLAMFCALVGPEPLQPLDRKFVALVAGAMAGRLHAILTERRLAAERVAAERRALAVRHGAVLRRLVNGVAHELNTPLGVQIAACDSLARLLAENADAEQLVDTVWLVERQARHAAAIVRRLKKVSAAMQGSAPTRLPLTETLAEILDVHDQGRSAVQAEVEGPSGLVLELDRLAFIAVVDELLDNVRDFAHAERQLRLRVRPDAPAGSIEIDVEDDGPGLEPALLPHYFEPFGAGQRRPGHLGLGGYIVQSLCRDALGGEASIRSAPGRGTCVTLRLPMHRP